MFVETQQYSERVLGLGIWDPPQTPWIKKRAGQWLPESFAMQIGNRKLEMTGDSLDALVERIEDARSSGADEVDVEGESHPLPEVEAAIADIRAKDFTTEAPPQAEPDPDRAPPDDPHVLQIKTNIDNVDYEIARPLRPIADGRELPSDRLSTRPKPHQNDGFRWLVDAWVGGWPGVLLADDMGLGKTFQALAFLVWVRRNQQAVVAAGKSIPKGPILIVAPTALLRNWVAEAERHLEHGSLGECVEAFGPGLKRLKRKKTPGWTPEDAIDVSALKDADWILTTYETLADNHRAFARVAYSVAIFDEMQKIKAPGTINTHAAKSINADFVLGLTGTPIENRIEDLWCLMDRIVPGYLGDLKSFSKTHQDENQEALQILKAKLDEPNGSAPAVMLRRMKDGILEGLPKKSVVPYPLEMPLAQANAYSAAVKEAHAGGRTPMAMLKAIHAFRSISLHPEGAAEVDGFDPAALHDWIEKSARVKQVVAVLRTIEKQDEKALVFIEDRAMQSTFAAAAATLFGFRSVPAIINGEVPGDKRQAIVDRFQSAPPGFDLLVLSPKAAGIGLTITAANHVIHLSRWWNPAVEDQCNDRVYRIGQDKPVTIHVPIAIHPDFGAQSFDVTLDGLLERKRSLSRHMLAPPLGAGDVSSLFGESLGLQETQIDGRSQIS